MIVLSVGEKVNPDRGSRAHPRSAAQAIRGGRRSPSLSRGRHIDLNADAWRRFAAESGLDAERPNHAAGKIEVLARPILPLTTVPRYAQVRAVHLALESWTIDAGLPTPTLKVKKGHRAANVAAEINALYGEPPLDRASRSG